MRIERIYSRNVVSTPRSASIMEAAQLMRRFHVGALVVTDDEAPGVRKATGIVTDRDLVLQSLANGIGPRDAVVGDVMSEGLTTIPADSDVFDALEIMRGNGVRRLAVSDAEGNLLGVLSVDDVIGAFGTELGSLAGILAREVQNEHDQGRRGAIMLAMG